MNEPQDPIIAAAKRCPNCEELTCPGLHSQGCWQARAFKAEKKLEETESRVTDVTVEAVVERINLVLDGGWPGGGFANQNLNELAKRIRVMIQPLRDAVTQLIVSGSFEAGTAGWRAAVKQAEDAIRSTVQPFPSSTEAPLTPIPMLIWCPMCKTRHIDKGRFATHPHHTHSCQNKECGLTWRPAIPPTVGVATLPGFLDEE